MNDFSPQLTCYRPSGIAPFGGVAATLVLGCASGVLLGAVYAFLNHHDPLVYLNLVLTLFLAYLIGWILSKGVRKFQVRNTLVAAVMGASVFAVTYFVHWFVYLATVLVDFETDSPYDIATIADVVLVLVQNPEDAWMLIQEFNREGVWTLTSSSGTASDVIKGVPLTVIWIVEALILGYHAVKSPLEEAGKPYSERLGKWMEFKTLPTGIAFVENVENFKSAIARNDYSALTTLFSEEANIPPQDRKTRYRKYATVDLYPDPAEPYISVQNVTVKIKKKKEEVSTKNVIRYLKISPTVAQNIASALEPRVEESV
ncbi:MAG: hypothetical protein LBP21_06830 [Synergistaceae bacterium]|jgi:hypothetical protein|nr:hypothetical protein [Synergistaceae bacterium]